MRLTCPNCDAQYEVPDEVIPQDGRDVQCSNCGKTWYQHHPDHEDQADADALNIPDPDEETAPPPQPAMPAPQPAASPQPAPPPQPTPRPVPQRKELDPSVSEILRQEAEAERAARRREAQSIESQPDLGLDAPDASDARPLSARTHTAKLRGEEPEISDEAATAAAISSRRDLLPDIEEINSTLRSTSDRAPAGDDGHAQIDAPTEQRKKRGFRTGFLVMLLLLVFALLIYIFAADLAQMVPALTETLQAYVDFVNGLRLWLDGQLRQLTAWLDTMASQSSGEASAPAE
ncbi:MAG: zinc-ribbon domain-containing protein [Sulfitobacter sp.]